MTDRPRAVRHAILTYLQESGERPSTSDGLVELLAGVHEFCRDRDQSYTHAWTTAGRKYRRRSSHDKARSQ